jgi:hypothetical protein
MRLLNITILLLVILFMSSCGSPFKEVKQLSEYTKTEFLPTLENKISADKNSVYCVSLLYAWNEIRNTLNSNLKISKQSKDFKLLNESKSHIDVLSKEEYSAQGEIDGDLISLNADFKKSLPLEYKLASLNNKLVFNQLKVASFGTLANAKKEGSIVEILYYKNDKNFVIKLNPKDKQHEIVLFMSENQFETMKEIVLEISKKIKKGKSDSKIDKLSWKYEFKDVDEVIIPKFNFNIETNFPTLEGREFYSKSNHYVIETALQRTAFLLDENGAEIESHSEFFSFKTEEVEEEDTPKPKKMIFDKPFFIMLKKVKSKYPYFGIWVNNAELMQLE